MSPPKAHIINHTHWDREWFLTSAYTSRWIPGLIDRLEKLVADNPGYRFLLDGQTLVIEDLLAVAPAYERRVRALITAGQLIVGPYYSQPDWRLAGGELLIRNLLLGQQDGRRLGGSAATGWLVDTFGHISQAPQIHRLFGIESVYVWRGVPRLAPYFTWHGADGSQLLTINLFGGYRNLYGVSRVPEVAVKRLEAEVAKLQPFYPTADVPLFDGYDLEDDPEDPVRFYALLGESGPEIALQESTPEEFARQVAGQPSPRPAIAGELNSGKYGATFPGTLSARTYLKVMARDCEQMLFQLAEALAALAWLKGRPYDAGRYEGWARLLLQNAVHDCICGVSIDPVHEKMERRYRQAFDAMRSDIQESLAAILGEFTAGDYAISTNPFAVDEWRPVGGELVRVQTSGVGVWPIEERLSLEGSGEVVPLFSWANGHYAATLGPDGVVRVGEATLGALVVWTERGDAYSDERGECLGSIRPSSPLTIEQRSARHCVVGFRGEWQRGEARATAGVRLHFDGSPAIRWQVDLETRGTDLRVEICFETALMGDVAAGMPFDVVQRSVVDRDLLPRALPASLDRVLMGQREVGAVSTFPCHDFVATSDGRATVAILAKGIHAYTADEAGQICLPLQRAVEWLTRADLAGRVGDAGPFFYVPDARGERAVRHELAVAVGRFAPDSLALQRLNAGFQNPPLVARAYGQGLETSWRLLAEDLPLSSLGIQSGVALARFYNPTPGACSLSRAYAQTDVWGQASGTVTAVAPKQIVTVQLPVAPAAGRRKAGVKGVTLPVWRVGPSTGRPDPAILAQLEGKIARLDGEVAEMEGELGGTEGPARLRLLHRCAVLERERLELQLAHLLAQRKLAPGSMVRDEDPDALDPEVAAVGLALNRARIKRRIFDYVAQVL
jgi:alpha-mannosidase